MRQDLKPMLLDWNCKTRFKNEVYFLGLCEGDRGLFLYQEA